MTDVHDGSVFPRGGRNKPSSKKLEKVERIRDDFLFGKSDPVEKGSKTQGNKKKTKKKKQPEKKENKRKIKGAHDSDPQDEVVRALRVAIPPRAQYLNAKKIKIGMKLFGVIKSVNDNARNPSNGNMVISLPNGLNGLVQYKEVSDELANLVSATKNATDVPLLSTLVKIGQYVACVVTVSTTSGGRGSSSRLELSTRASSVNKGYFIEDLAEPNSVVFGSVRSVEDHGYIVGLGMGNRLTGFISFSVAGGNPDEPTLAVGQPVFCSVLPDSKSKANKKARVHVTSTMTRSLALTNDPKILSSTTARMSDSIAISSLRPGLLVEAKIKKVLPNGLWVSFLGVFSGAIDWFHLGVAPTSNWAKPFLPPTEIKSVKARILYVDSEAGYATLTMAPHAVSLEGVPAGPEIGQLVSARIEHVEAKLGVLVSFTKSGADDESDEESEVEDDESASDILKTTKTYGYAHISSLVDGRLEHLEKKFKVGSVRESRVVGISPLDGFHMLSFRPSVLGASVLRYDDLEPGKKVEAEIVRAGAFGVIVSMGNNVTGVVSATQLAEATVKDPAKRFKVGQSVSCRVLTVEPKTRKAQLTMIPTLMKTELPTIKSYENVLEGQTSHGFVSSVTPVGVFVTFFNGVYGVVPNKALAAHGVNDPSKVYRVGQAMKSRVVQVDPKRRRMTLSFRTSKAAEDATGARKRSASEISEQSKKYTVGSFVSGTIVRVTENDVYVRLEGAGQDDVRGRVPKAHLSDHPGNCDVLLSTFKPGATLHGALILDIPKKRAAKRAKSGGPGEPQDLPFLLTLKPALVLAAKHNTLPSAVEEVQKDQMLVGYVANVTPFGVFVRYLGTLASLAPKANVSDDFVSNPAEHCEVGQTVRASVVDVDVGSKRIVVSLKPSVVGGRDPLFLHGLWTEQRFAFEFEAQQMKRAAKKGQSEDDASDKTAMSKLKLGQLTSGTVQDVKHFGLILELDQGVIGFCMTQHMPKDAPAVGSRVECRVLDLDFEKGIVDVTMRQTLLKPCKGGRIPFADVESIPAVCGAVVELAKQNYVVLSLPKMKHALVMAPVSSFNGKAHGLDSVAVGVSCSVRKYVQTELEETSVRRHGSLPVPVVEILPESEMASRRPRSMSDPFHSLVPGSDLAIAANDEKVDLAVSNLVAGKVFGVREGWVNVKLLNATPAVKHDNLLRATIHLTELADPEELGPGENVLSVLSVGQLLPKCKVVATKVSQMENTKQGLEKATLTTRNSDLSGNPAERVSWESVKLGETYPGWVQAVRGNGLLVCLSMEVRGVVYCANISSSLEEVSAVFSDESAGPSDKEKLEKHFPPGHFFPSVKVVGLSRGSKQIELAVQSAR